ncbi:pentatricopeptide repeat-containing protein At2g15820, chloroplastic [Nicotiana tabacum]|uniref:Pentatricopeptide repeat-containing protein At2g15820, chloroplastic n=1 Tax=Nicotiana tabacum TaxID=4097 RepID=A0A1S4CXN9_TOBAC|nr:PREDICTED: pentatricopeptide repeat-containing protein At2g15820, chloroplastic-like [Nicotiana tabacum]
MMIISFVQYPMSTALTFLHSLSSSPFHHRHRPRLLSTSSPFSLPLKPLSFSPLSTLPQQVLFSSHEIQGNNNLDISSSGFPESFNFDESFDSTELKKFETPAVEVSELEDIPDQWRRSRLAWLCKELPAHKTPTMVRILNAQRKWLKQEDATYIAVHCMRIRENEAAFRVYKWMMQQHWFRFDFALATKLADYLGKERKHLKCREIFDDIINQGRVPSESTFHILIIAYLSSPGPSELDEACNIYNRMVHLGGHKPRLNLHNSLFKALLGKKPGSSKHFLKQAEFIYQNLTSSGLDIHKDIFGGLIWLHSYQDVVDMERIAVLRAEMRSRGIQESKEVLLSVLRACSKDGDLEEAERTWSKLLSDDRSPPSQAFVYKMEVYAKNGEPMKSLEVFRRMQKQLSSTSVAAYYKIIKVLSKSQRLDLAESIMSEFINSGMKPLIPSFIDLMGMYSIAGLHEKMETTFLRCREVCGPNQTVFNIYLDSLVHTGNLNRAEEIFNEMRGDVAISLDSRSCNSILRGYLTSGEYAKAEKIYGLMRQKKYDIEIESSLMEKLDYVLSLREKVVEEPIKLKLTKEQREVLMGLLLGGLQIRSYGERRRRVHAIHFEFNAESRIHAILKGHIHNEFHQWLGSHDMMVDGTDDIPSSFTTISHSCFTFYADQFWPNGRPGIPKLIHRWLSPCVLAYWYMYGGYRTSSGDILLRVKGSREEVLNIVKALKDKSLDCRVKKRGTVFWIGFLGDNATWFWTVVKPFILGELKDLLKAGGCSNGSLENQRINFYSGSGSDEKNSDYSDADTS